MKFGFVTCVQLGLACMEEIYQMGGKLDLVITLKDQIARQKSGRIYVDDFCVQHHINNVVKIRNVNDTEAIAAVQTLEVDWLFIIGWSQIARKPMLDAPRRGVLGMHPTLLPQGRGRAAIPWAIIKGLEQTGVTLFKLDEGVDTGPILAQEVLSLSPNETATTLYERVATAHRTLMRHVWVDLVNDRLVLQPQDEHLATEWPGRTPEDGIIDPKVMDCLAVDRLVRAVTHPYPGAFLDWAGTRYRIWAGQSYIGRKENQSVQIDGDHLRFQLQDGSYQATVWESEALAVTQI
jgi:methionyl-tRNA formyltransferase